MRGPKALLMSLTMLLLLCAPALAQSAPAASQYGEVLNGEETERKRCPPGSELGVSENQVQNDVGAGACASAENVGQGTEAVNDALSETGSPGASASGETSTSSESAASPSAASPGDASSVPSESQPPDSAAPEASSESASSPDVAGGDDASAQGGTDGDDGGLASITELPETGGASPAPLGLGILLITLGLATRKVAGR